MHVSCYNSFLWCQVSWQLHPGQNTGDFATVWSYSSRKQVGTGYWHQIHANYSSVIADWKKASLLIQRFWVKIRVYVLASITFSIRFMCAVTRAIAPWIISTHGELLIGQDGITGFFLTRYSTFNSHFFSPYKGPKTKKEPRDSKIIN